MDALAARAVEVLQASLSSDPNLRHQAEAAIKEICDQPGFLSVLFRITMEDTAPFGIKQAASILLKNEVLAKWAKYTFDPATDSRKRLPCQYTQEEQEFVRGNIINCMLHVSHQLRPILGIAFASIAYADFPTIWKDLFTVLLQNAQSNDPAVIYVACYCIRHLFKKFELQRKKKELFHGMISQAMPVLLKVFGDISTIDNNQSVEIQVLICKIFYSTLSVGIPPYLLQGDVFLSWLKLLMQVYSRDVAIPPNIQESEIYQSNPWWKAQKWCIQICHKLIAIRARQDDTSTTEQFLKHFLANYAVPIQQAVLGRLGKIQNGQGYLPPRIVAYSFLFLTEAILPSVTYKAIVPHIEQFLQTVLFPVLFFTSEDQEVWDSDPEEFIRREHDIIHDDLTPKKIALEFLYELVTQRSKTHMLSFVQFLITKLNQYQQSDAKNFQDKYAALTVFCTLSTKLKATQEFSGQLEDFVAVHVIGELNSKFGFLRSKACWTFCLFSDIDFRNPEVFVHGVRSTLTCMQDSELPVQIVAGIGLKFAINNPLAETIIQENLSQILDLYLKLLSEMDNDELISALEYIIIKFQEHIGPHALQLLHNFWQVFLRIISEDDDDSTGLASLECLRAILVVLTSISERPDLYKQAEPILLPGLRENLNSANLEYFEDFTRILSCFACYSETISDALWDFVPLLYEQFDSWGLDFLPNILISYDNIITADKEGFAKRNYFVLLYKMFSKVMSMGSNEILEPVQVASCQLIELGIQNCLGTANDFVEGILQFCMARMDQHFFGIALPTVMFNVFGNLLFYNPALTLAILDKKNWTQELFTQWFTFFEHFQRIYDRKVTVLGLSSIFLVPSAQWPAVVKGSIQNVFASCLILLRDAVQMRMAKEQTQGLDEKQITFADEALVNTIRSAISTKDSDQLGMGTEDDLRNEYAVPAGEAALDDWINSDPNELEDEDEVTTAIDPINEVSFFFHALSVLQNNDGTLFGQLCSSLTPEQQGIMQQLNALANQN